MWERAPLPAWWRDTFRITRWPTDAEIATILAAGDSGVRAMFAVIDPRHAERPIPQAEPEAREFAVGVLGLFRRADLVAPLFALLDHPDCDESLMQALAGAIAACGPGAAPGAVARFLRTEPGAPTRAWWAEIAAKCGACDASCAAVLVTYLREQPLHGAMLASASKDARLVPALLAVIDETAARQGGAEDDDADPLAETLVCLADAVRACGGDLGDARRALLAPAEGTMRARRLETRREHIAHQGLGSIGSEVPALTAGCICGSDRTYAMCCAAEEADLHAQAIARIRAVKSFL